MESKLCELEVRFNIIKEQNEKLIDKLKVSEKEMIIFKMVCGEVQKNE